MGASLLFILFFSSTLLSADGLQAICPSVQCSDGGPAIHFPFRVIGRQPQHCGLPGFELVCKENTAALHFPSYGNLAVKSISYDTQTLHLLDPKNCVHGAFLNLNLSFTPFEYYYVVNNYTYINCSTRLSPSFTEIPCLSGLAHHVYTVESSSGIPGGCRPMKTIPIPFPYISYVSDNSFGLRLTWTLSGFKNCKGKGDHCGFLSKAGITAGLDVAQDSGFSITQFILSEIRAMFSKVQNGF